MATETLTKEAAKAIEYFEAKLAFEMLIDFEAALKKTSEGIDKQSSK